jgi:hypothetical protein
VVDDRRELAVVTKVREGEVWDDVVVVMWRIFLDTTASPVPRF